MDYDAENERIKKEIERVNNKFSALLIEYIAKFSVRGQLEYDDSMAFLEQDIAKILKEAGYSDAISGYFEYFTKILTSTISNYTRVAEVEQALSQSRSADLITQSTTDSLKGLGIKENIINPLAKQIRTFILTGGTYNDLKGFLKNSIENNGKLTQYVTQITVDAFSQYDGALQNEIKTKFKPTKFYYIGDEIETSRPFCTHMKDTYGSSPISIEQLEKDLNEYCHNGIPSEKSITINGKQKKKGAGMLEGTTVTNFDINRGGFQCRHKVRWIIE